MKNILYISYDGMTDPLGQSQVLPYLIGISKEYNVHLISFEKSNRLKEHKAKIKAICKVNNITWYPEGYTKNPQVLSTLFDIQKLFRKARKLDKTYNFEIIHCRSYISALIGLSFKRKENKKFIFDMRGFWANERVDGGIWKLKNPILRIVYHYFKKKEKHYFEESDAIISLTENGKKEILSWNLSNVTDDKIMVIPCCVNTDLFDYNRINLEDKNKLKSSLHINESDFVLGYVGSIGTWYMLPEMLDFFKELLNNKPNAKFLFVTGESPENIKNIALKKGISSEKIIVQKCLHDEVPNYISLFDWSVFFILPVYSKKASSPTKQGEIMAMGIPVVCNAGIGDTDLIVNKNHSGIVIEYCNSSFYKEGVQRMSEFILDKKKMREGAIEVFGLDNGVDSYLAVYKKLYI